MQPTPVRLAAALAVAAASLEAQAAGFALIEQNASGLGNAYAGQAAAAYDASTVFFNPAGMTRLGGPQIVLSGHLIKPRAEFRDNGSTAAPLQTLGGNGGDAGGVGFVPNLYYTHPVNDRLTLGIGINAPFGLKTEYDADWVGRFLAVNSKVESINVNPALAVKLNDTVSVGLGIDYQKLDATLTNMVNYSAAIAGGGGPIVPGLQGLATVKGDDWGWGWNAGLMADLGATRIGVNYRSEIDYTLAGSVSFGNRPAALAAALPDGPVTAKTTMPASASLSVFHALSPTVDLLADLTWTGWSSFDKLAIVRTSGALVGATPENWDDTLRYSVGINYKPGGAWTWRAGIAYDETPVPDRYRTPRIPDQNRTWLALGGQFRIDRANAVDFGYAHLFVPNADMSASVNNTAPGAGVLRGEYDNAVDILSAQYTHTF